MFVDTHAHIHFADYELDPNLAIENATQAGVTKILCVGTDELNSKLAIDFVKGSTNCFATAGLHPHEAKKGQVALDKIAELAQDPAIVAIGECGLDYYYNHSPKEAQEKALRSQVELALKLNKSLIFHVREAFADFMRIVSDYKAVKGVVHSFSSSKEDLMDVLEHGFYVGINGIMTFTKDQAQLDAAKAIPADKLLLETDSPYLTPAPFRGKINEPANVRLVAEFLAKLRGETLEDLAKNTTNNAQILFGI